MTRDEMWHKACERFETWACMYADKNVTDEQFFNELCCSVYAGEEFEKPEPKNPVLNDNFEFKYKGYIFELSNCIAETNSNIRTKEIRSNPLSNRYVCWMFGHKDNVCLVPGAWAWGSEDDFVPGREVEQLIIDAIDKFLEQNPDL